MPVSPPPPTGNCAARKKEKEGIFQDRCQHKKREREREREKLHKRYAVTRKGRMRVLKKLCSKY
jgi:hypothetical protein